MNMQSSAQPPRLNNLVLMTRETESLFSPTGATLTPSGAIPLVEGKIEYPSVQRSQTSINLVPSEAKSLKHTRSNTTGFLITDQSAGPSSHVLATSCQRLNHGLPVNPDSAGEGPGFGSLPVPPPGVCESPVHKKGPTHPSNLPLSLRNMPNTATLSPNTQVQSPRLQDTPARRQTPQQIRKTTRVRLNNKKVLGKGSWGTVFVGLNEQTRELIAVKEVTFTSKEEVEQSAREIRVMKNLDHPNIVKYLGADRDENTLKIYMEYIVGGSLAALIKNFGVFTELMTQGYCVQVLEGLQYLHGKNIAHRDIKCDNLLVEKNGDVKLADFGQSKDAGEILKTVTGTAYFMAPEVIKGEEYTLKADIWSFGCAVIEMLTGRPPFSHYENQWAAMYHITNGDPSVEVPQVCSAEASNCLMCCLSREPRGRWPASQILAHPWLANKTESICAVRQSAANLQLHRSAYGFDSPPDSPPSGSSREDPPRKNTEDPASPVMYPSPPSTPPNNFRRLEHFQDVSLPTDTVDETSKGSARGRPQVKKQPAAILPQPSLQESGRTTTHDDVISQLQAYSDSATVPPSQHVAPSAPLTPHSERRRKEKSREKEKFPGGKQNEEAKTTTREAVKQRRGANTATPECDIAMLPPPSFTGPPSEVHQKRDTDVVEVVSWRDTRSPEQGKRHLDKTLFPDDRLTTPPTIMPIQGRRMSQEHGAGGSQAPGAAYRRNKIVTPPARARVSPGKIRVDIKGDVREGNKPRVEVVTGMGELGKQDSEKLQERSRAVTQKSKGIAGNRKAPAPTPLAQNGEELQAAVLGKPSPSSLHVQELSPRSAERRKRRQVSEEGDSPYTGRRNECESKFNQNAFINDGLEMLPPPSAPTPTPDEFFVVTEDEQGSAAVDTPCKDEVGQHLNPTESCHPRASFGDIENINPMQSFGVDSENLQPGSFAAHALTRIPA